jgi:hypothetical protein
LAWLGVGAGVFVLAWPAMWVQPGSVLSQVFGLVQDFAESGHESALFFNGRVISGGDFGAAYFYFYPLTYLWRATPAVLAGLPLAVIFLLRRQSPFDHPAARRAFWGLALLAAVFTLGLAFPAKKFDRYYLPVYAPLDLLASLGWAGLMALLGSNIHNIRWRWAAALPLLAALGVQAASAWASFPYYFTYYNPLLGGAERAPEVMQVGWGEGLDEAARYLNRKPDAASLDVITWYAAGCFSYYFRGRGIDFWASVETPAKGWSDFQKADYAVVYISQAQRGLSRQALDELSRLQPEHTIHIDGLEYVRIYKLH